MLVVIDESNFFSHSLVNQIPVMDIAIPTMMNTSMGRYTCTKDLRLDESDSEVIWASMISFSLASFVILTTSSIAYALNFEWLVLRLCLVGSSFKQIPMSLGIGLGIAELAYYAKMLRVKE